MNIEKISDDSKYIKDICNNGSASAEEKEVCNNIRKIEKYVIDKQQVNISDNYHNLKGLDYQILFGLLKNMG